MNKRIVILLSILFTFILIFIIIFLNSDTRKQKKINDYAIEVGSKFYTEFYYKNLNNELFEIFSEKGIKVSLEDLSNYDFLSEYFDNNVFYYEGNECDKENSMIIIYPKKPYLVNDFDIKISLNCGF